jgi:glucosylceramidase
VLNDAGARAYVDGSAFHLYGGSISALSTVHDAYPTKHIYFTEQWVGGPGNLAEDLKWHVENLIIGATRNWSRNVLEWILASDLTYDPHTVGGCDRCLGTVTINGNAVKRNPAYYILAHASRFVRPGSLRVSSNLPGNLPNVAFMTPDGKKVLVVVNTAPSKKNFNIKFRGNTLKLSLEGGAVGTYIW